MSLDLLVHLSVQPSVARSFFCSTFEYLLVCEIYSGSTPPRKIIRTHRIALVPTIGVGWSGLARPQEWQTWFSPSSHWSLNWFLPLEMQFYPSHVLLVRAFWFEMLLKQITLVNPFGSYLTLTNFFIGNSRNKNFSDFLWCLPWGGLNTTLVCFLDDWWQFCLWSYILPNCWAKILKWWR